MAMCSGFVGCQLVLPVDDLSKGATAASEGGPSAGDPSSTDAGAEAGVSLRAVEKTQSDSTSSLVVDRPATVQPGDVIFVVLAAVANLGTWTGPAGFDTLSAGAWVCGTPGTDLHVLVHAAQDGDPAQYTFTFPSPVRASLTLLALTGLSSSPPFPETSAYGKIGLTAAPIQPTALPATEASYGLVTYVQLLESSGVFSAPSGMTRLSDAYGTAIYGSLVDAGAAFQPPAVTLEPWSCGYWQTTLFRVK
jgi:hypothetical protein